MPIGLTSPRTCLHLLQCADACQSGNNPRIVFVPSVRYECLGARTLPGEPGDGSGAQSTLAVPQSTAAPRATPANGGGNAATDSSGEGGSKEARPVAETAGIIVFAASAGIAVLAGLYFLLRSCCTREEKSDRADLPQAWCGQATVEVRTSLPASAGLALPGATPALSHARLSPQAHPAGGPCLHR